MSPMANMEGWVGVTDVASHLGVNKDSIYRWINTKGFPAHRVGRLLRFSKVMPVSGPCIGD